MSSDFRDNEERHRFELDVEGKTAFVSYRKTPDAITLVHTVVPPELVKRRPDLTTEMAEKFLTRMYRTDPDFVFTVTRDFVRNCRTPALILPDDIPAHPYAVAMESALLAPNAEVSLFPWKEPKERVPLAVRQIRSFLRAHRPASA